MNNNYEYKFIECKHPKEKKGTILFIHGFGVNYEYHTADEALTEQYDYYAVNLPGHENTVNKRNKKELTIKNIAKHVVGFINEMKLDNFILMGHSMGGMIAAFVYAQAPTKIKKVILVSPANWSNVYTARIFLSGIFYPINYPQKIDLLNYLYYDYRQYRHDQEWVNTTRKELDFVITHLKEIKKVGRSMSINFSSILKVQKCLRKINVPTLVMLGEHDEIMLYKQTKRNLCKIIKHVSLVTFVKSGHVSFIEEPKKYITEIFNFLDNN